MATSMSVSDSSYTILSISSTDQSRRNWSLGRTGWPSGVSAWWKAYRWLLNILPAEPSVLLSSKLNGCATQSNTKASLIIAQWSPLLRRVGQMRRQVFTPIEHSAWGRQEP